MSCEFCGYKIKEGDKWFNYWAIGEQKFYKICLKCADRIKEI